MSSRYLLLPSFLLFVLPLAWTALSCVQPVDGVATAEENFDTSRPATPAASAVTDPVPQTINGETINFFPAAPEFNFTLAPGAPARYRVNGGSWVGPATDVTSFDATGFGDGSYVLELQERDESGNWSEPYVYRFVIDTVDPAAPVSSGSNPAVTATLTPRFYWYGDPNDGSRVFSATIKGPGVQETPLPLFDFSNLSPGSEFSAAPMTFTGDGTATLTVRERDYAGRESATTTISQTIDTSGPLFVAQPVPLTNRPAGHRWSWQTNGADNGDGIFRYELRTSPLPGDLIASGSGSSYVTPALADGAYQLRVRESRNNGSYWSGWSPSGVLTIDTTPPAAPELDEAPKSVGDDSTPYFAWKGSGESGGSFTIELKGPTNVGPLTVFDTTYTAPALIDGEYSFSLREVDEAGNVSPAAGADFYIDSAPPEAPRDLLVDGLTGAFPNRYTLSAEPDISWSSAGGDGSGTFRWSFDGGKTVSAPEETTTLDDYSLGSGVYEFVVQEQDGVGNWSSWSEPVEFVAEPRFFSRAELWFEVGPTYTGSSTVRLIRNGVTLGSASTVPIDDPQNLGASGWYSFSFPDIPVAPGEIIVLSLGRSNPHDDQSGDYAYWFASNSDAYSLGQGPATYDFAFRTYTKSEPQQPAEEIDQSQELTERSYALFDYADQTQEIYVGP